MSDNHHTSIVPDHIVGVTTITADEIDRRLADYAEAARGAYATATEKARAADSRIWAEWCADRSVQIVPAEPAIVAAFIDEMSETRKPATVRRYVQTINQLHKAAGFDRPSATNLVGLALRRMNRAKGTAQQQAAPLTLSPIRAMLAKIATDTPGLDLTTKSGHRRAIANDRDRALIALAYFAGMRRSEIVALDVEDLDLTPVDDSGACCVMVRWSKTDQTGKGERRGISREVADLLRLYTARASITSGPLFRSMNGNRLSGIDIARILKKYAAAIGIDPASVSGHSTRVGTITDRRAKGQTTGQTADAIGHSEAMVERYSASVDVKQSAGRYAETLGNLIE